MLKRCASLGVVLLLAVSVFSCAKSRKISLDADADPMALMPGVEWAVITEPYATFQAESSYASSVINRGRKGDVLRVEGKAFVKTKLEAENVTVVWYCFEQGWLNESVIALYDNKYKAQTASRLLLGSE